VFQQTSGLINCLFQPSCCLAQLSCLAANWADLCRLNYSSSINCVVLRVHIELPHDSESLMKKNGAGDSRSGSLFDKISHFLFCSASVYNGMIYIFQFLYTTVSVHLIFTCHLLLLLLSVIKMHSLTLLSLLKKYLFLCNRSKCIFGLWHVIIRLL
jgi:hypothetical protein